MSNQLGDWALVLDAITLVIRPATSRHQRMMKEIPTLVITRAWSALLYAFSAFGFLEIALYGV